MKKILLHLFFLGAGCFLGIFIGKNSENSQEEIQSQEAPRKLSRSSISLNKNRLGTFSTTGHLTGQIRYYQSLSEGDLQGEFFHLQRLPFGEQALGLTALFSVWAEVNPAGALNAAKELGIAKNEIIAIVLKQWTKNDPLSAAEFYKKNEQGLFTRNFEAPWQQVSGSEVIAEALAKNDAHAALEWSSSLADLQDQEQAISSIFKALISVSSEKALSILQEMPIDGRRLHAIEAIAEAWGGINVEDAITWVNTLDQDEQPLALPKLLSGLAVEDPSSATQYLEYLSGNRDSVIEVIIDEWSKQSPREAADWLVSALDVEEHRFFFKPLFEKWIFQDQVAAKQWILKQEAGYSKEAALVAYIRSTASGLERPIELVGLAQREIHNQERQDIAITEALVALSRQDRAAASRLAEDSGISDSSLADFYHRINAQSPLD